MFGFRFPPLTIIIELLFLIFAANCVAETSHIITAVEQPLVVNGKKTQVFNLLQADGSEGYIGEKGQFFNVTLKNETHVPISIHWHGIILPNNQDGIPFVTQLPIQPGQTHQYHFKFVQAGTYWMHSHYKFHEQKLMAAPLIIKDPHDPYRVDKDLVILLEGFTFKNGEKILYDLKHQSSLHMKMMTTPDLNDVNFDAFLANRHTLRDPEIFSVHPGNMIRLRIINGSTASNFWVNTGKLPAKLIAVDGHNIIPITDKNFQLAVAQRIDLIVTIPKIGGVFPILAQVEGTKQRTGIVLKTSRFKVPVFSELSDARAPPLNDQQENQLHAIESLSHRPISRTLQFKLTGDMQNYIWKINNEIWPEINPLKIRKGERVEMVFMNDTNMAHPMHFHGHVFQVSEIQGNKLNNGPLRDTILVLPHSSKKIIFDADYPGIWMLHCHVLYHMNAGMMTTVNYLGYPEPYFYKALIAKPAKASL